MIIRKIPHGGKVSAVCLCKLREPDDLDIDDAAKRSKTVLVTGSFDGTLRIFDFSCSGESDGKTLRDGELDGKLKEVDPNISTEDEWDEFTVDNYKAGSGSEDAIRGLCANKDIAGLIVSCHQGISFAIISK